MHFITNILTLTFKEFRSLFSDKVLMIFIIYMFTGMAYNTAVNGGGEIKNAAVGIIDYDQTPLTRQIVDALPEPYFAKPYAIDPDEAQELLDKGQLTFVLEFPPNFQRDVQAGRAPEVQLRVDATAITQAGVGQGYISQVFSREVQSFQNMTQTVQNAMPARAVINTEYNGNNTSSWFMGVAQVNNNIMLITLILVGAAVIRERERGTMEHLLVMPIVSSEIVLSKILANGLVICAVAVLSMKFVIGGAVGVPLAGSLVLYALGAVLFMFTVASLSIMLATLAPTMPQYSLLMVPTYIIFMMFSGSVSPRGNMPEMAQWVSEYFPSTQFAYFAQAVLIRGAGVKVVYPNLLAMLFAGIVFLGLALLRFKKMLEKQG